MIKVNGLGVSRIPINGKETLRVMKNGEQLWSGTGLPAGYTLLEYIESTGTQYIDTGYIAKSENYKVNCRFSISELSTTAVLFGGGASTDIISIMTQNPAKIYVGGGRIIRDTIYFTTGQIHKMDCHANNGTFSIVFDGTTYSEAYTSTINKNYSLVLFGNNISGSISAMCKAKIYSFKIYDNNILVRDYIPCMSPNGVCGLFDKVNRKFYQSATSTPFTGDYFEEVEYIENNSSSYLNTGISPSTDLEVEIKYSPIGNLSEGAIFGSTWAANGYFLMTYNNVLRFHSRNYVFDDSNTLSAGVIKTIKTTIKSIAIDGVVSSWTQGTVSDTSNPITIFYADGYSAAKYGIGRVYSMKMYQGGVLVRDFIPIKGMISGNYGLYDKVNKQFYGSSSSTPFTGV